MNDVTVVFTYCGYFNNRKEGDRVFLAGVEELYYNLNKVDNIFNVNE